MDAKLAMFQDYASDKLDEVRAQFSDPVHVTLIVRNLADGTGERDVIVTDDTLEGIKAAVDHAEQRVARSRWEAAHPGEPHPGCTEIDGAPCVAWARKCACQHVHRAFWRSA